MEIGNLIFDLIVSVILFIFAVWMFVVVSNLIYLTKMLKKINQHKLKINLPLQIVNDFNWTIKNGFLFGTFRKDYYEIFRRRYHYGEIKNKEYRDLINGYGKFLRVPLAVFNLFFVLIVIVTFIFSIVGIALG